MADTAQPDTTAAADLRHWWQPLLAAMELGALNELRIRANKPHLHYCARCKSRTRVAYRLLDGRLYAVCRSCGAGDTTADSPVTE